MRHFIGLTIIFTLGGISSGFSQQPKCNCLESGSVHHRDGQLTGWLAQRGLRFDVIQYRNIRGKQVIAVPLDSVVENSGRYFILRRNDRVVAQLEPREVTLGQCNDHFVEVRTGVMPGEAIVATELAPRNVRDVDSFTLVCSCEKCSPRPSFYYTTPAERPLVRRQSDEYEAGFRDGYLAGTRKSSQQKKASNSHTKHGECGGDCKDCPSSSHEEDEIVFRKGNAKDSSSGYFVPQK